MRAGRTQGAFCLPNKCNPLFSPQFFFILLLIFIAEVAAAVVALVYTTMVSSEHRANWQALVGVGLSLPHPNTDVLLRCSDQAEQFLKLLIVPTIKDDYGSQKDFTEVWNTTMKAVRWGKATLSGMEKAARSHTDLPLLIVSSSSAVASTTTRILRSPLTSKSIILSPHSVASTTMAHLPWSPAPRRRLRSSKYRCGRPGQ